MIDAYGPWSGRTTSKSLAMRPKANMLHSIHEPETRPSHGSPRVD
jgi:hypothetical protein